MTRAYYNERDPFAAQWLRNLVAAELICAGDVDDRDIRDVRPSDLVGYTQCHFFAGIGVWSHALRLAGWPDDRPVWTGSCPCQPFSAAGRGGGFADERHLWPHWYHLIRERRPPVVFGEQVTSKNGLAWLDLVQSDLEGQGYACGAVDFCAAGVGAPHIRQRTWFVADAESVRRARPRSSAEPSGWNVTAHSDASGLMGDARRTGFSPCECTAAPRARWEKRRPTEQPGRPPFGFGHNGGPRPTFWSDAEWIDCRDGKSRPIEPGTFPLAHGAAARVGRLRAYGNAISPYPAVEVIQAYLETEKLRQGA